MTLPMDPQGSRGAADPLIGQMVGSYRIVRFLGSGSFAKVYLGEHPIIGSKVAVKIAEPHATADPDLLQRFIGEARAANLVAHEAVVRIYDINVLPDGRHYFVMEYLEGEPFSAICGRRVVPFEAALPLLVQMCEGLAAAHNAGVVHRDLKPDNIFMIHESGRDKVKIVDFGIARRASLGAGELRTQQGMVLGTPHYISPEQAAGQPIDLRADIYSLGCIMYELATGQRPFHSMSMMQMLLAHGTKAPPPPRDVNPSISAEYEALILRCLAKKPADRFQSMGELAKALQHIPLRPETVLMNLHALPASPARGPSDESDPSLSSTFRSAPSTLGPRGLMLQFLERAAALEADDCYALLELDLGADPVAVQQATQRISKLIDTAAQLPDLTPLEHERLDAVRVKVGLAEETLRDPQLRVVHDAAMGNFLGVARCLEANLSRAVIEKLRKEFLAKKPNLAAILKPVMKKVEESVRQSNPAATKMALAMALRLDPLNLELHERYAHLAGAGG